MHNRRYFRFYFAFLAICSLLLPAVLIADDSFLISCSMHTSADQITLPAKQLSNDGSKLPPVGSVDLQRYSKDVLHQLAGDDLIAYFGFRPNFNFVRSSNPNAFALKPNKLIISSRLLNLVESPSEFAFIIAHEMGHLVSKNQAISSTLTGDNGTVQSLIDQEIEADLYAKGLLASSGFDPAAGLNLLTKLGDLKNQAGISLSSVYPSIPSRINALRISLEDQRTVFP